MVCIFAVAALSTHAAIRLVSSMLSILMNCVLPLPSEIRTPFLKYSTMVFAASLPSTVVSNQSTIAAVRSVCGRFQIAATRLKMGSL